MSVQSPNMNLTLPGVATEPGPAWATELNSSLTVIDSHNHAPGSGVQINPSGLNINSSLTFNNQQAIALQATVFQQQASALSTLYNSLFVQTDGNLYFEPGYGGTPIQITNAGTVNVVSSGISDGMGSTASFVAHQLVVSSATNTPGNILAGSIFIGQNVSGSNYVELSPPSAVSGGSYTLVLPAIPTSASFLTLDTSGNIGTISQTSVFVQTANIAPGAVTGGTGGSIASATITGANIAASTITGSNIASATITGSNIASGTITDGNIASVSGNAIDAGTTPVSAMADVLSTSNFAQTGTINGSFSINSTPTVLGTTGTLAAVEGRPFFISLVSTTSGGGYFSNSTGSPIIHINGTNGGTKFKNWYMSFSGTTNIPCGALTIIDYPFLTGALGNWTFTISVSIASGSSTFVMSNCFLNVFQV